MYEGLLLALYFLVCIYLAVEIANRVFCGWGREARAYARARRTQAANSGLADTG